MSAAPSSTTASPVSQPDRLVSVQILRGVAAMLVVWLHLNVGLFNIRSEAGPSAIGQFGKTYQFGAIGVDIFFLISGFVMAFTMQQYEGRPFHFIRQRFLRVAPLAYVAAAAWIGIMVVTGRPVAPLGIVSCITFLPLLPHYTAPTLQVLWTLSFEFTFYLLVAGALALRLGPRQLFWITAALGTTGFMVTMPIPLLRWFTHPMLLEFAVGIAAFLVWRTNQLSRASVVCFGAVGLGILVMEALLGAHIESDPKLTITGSMAGPRLLVWALPSFFLLIALLRWRPGDGWAVRLGQRIGDASYSIYLTNLLPIRATTHWLPLPADIRWLVGFVAAVGTGLLVHRHVERPLLERMLKKPKVRPIPKAGISTYPRSSKPIAPTVSA